MHRTVNDGDYLWSMFYSGLEWDFEVTMVTFFIFLVIQVDGEIVVDDLTVIL